jgi:hypothetical protein
MAPPLRKANVVADAIVTRLELLHSAFDADVHHVQPKQVKRGVPIDALTISPLPAYLVSVLGWQRTRQFASRHGLTVNVGVHVLIDAPRNVEARIVEAASDIELVLQGYETLGGVAQQLGDITVELDHVKVGSSERAYGLVTIPVVMTTDHTAP